jgi:ABC-2 type transport system permease protein
MTTTLTGRDAPRGLVRLVAGREIASRLRARAFAYSTLLTVVVIAAAVVVPGLLAGGGGSPRMAVAGIAVRELGPVPGVRLAAVPDAATAQAAVATGHADLALVVAGTRTRLLVTGGTSAAARQSVVELLRQRAESAELRRQAVDTGALRRAVAASAPGITYVHGDAGAADRTGVALVVSIVLFLQLFTYGVAVATGVVEEKSSRVVELLLATVHPRQLLAGKVLGIGAVALLQLCLYALVGCTLALATGALALPSGALLVTVAGAVGAFLLGFTFFAFAYGAGGSLVSRQEDVTAAIAPVSLLAFGTYFTAVYAAQDLAAGWVGMLSYVPPFSVLLMPMRLGAGGVGARALLLAVAAMAGATVLVAWLGSAVYARSVLLVGRRTRLAELVRGVRPRHR